MNGELLVNNAQSLLRSKHSPSLSRLDKLMHHPWLLLALDAAHGPSCHSATLLRPAYLIDLVGICVLLI